MSDTEWSKERISGLRMEFTATIDPYMSPEYRRLAFIIRSALDEIERLNERLDRLDREVDKFTNLAYQQGYQDGGKDGYQDAKDSQA